MAGKGGDVSMQTRGRHLATVVAMALAASVIGPTTAGAIPTTRYAGVNRYETAIAVSKSFDPGVPVVVVASGESFPDALAGAPAAVQSGPGPVLLTPRNALPASVASEVARLDAERIVVLGGDAAVSSDVVSELGRYGTVERIAGRDRYETAALIASDAFARSDTVLLATGERFPDALAAAAAGAAQGWPVLLTASDQLPAATAEALTSLSPSRVVIVGAAGAVSAAVEEDVRQRVPSVTRIGGIDRYATSAAMTAYAFQGGNTTDAFVATGLNYPDALAGAAAAGRSGAPLVLVPGDCVPPAVANELARLEPEQLVLLGGEGVVSSSVGDVVRCVTEPRYEPRREVARVSTTPRGDREGGIETTLFELAAVDLTGDGLDDILVTRARFASPEVWPISVLVNDGAGGFSDKTSEVIEGPVPYAQHPRQIVLADLNADDRTDVLIADHGQDAPPFSGYRSHLLLSTANGRYVDASANLPQDPGFSHTAALGDVDGDGDVDVFLGKRPLDLFLNDGTGQFTKASPFVPDHVSASAVGRSALVDVSGDGLVDLVLLGVPGESFVLVNDGTGRFEELPDALPPKPFRDDANGVSMLPTDLDGDEHIDLVLGYTKHEPFYEGRWLQMLVNNGDGTFRDETSTRLPQTDNALQWPYDIVPGDLNGDGFQDFVVDMGPTFANPGAHGVPVFFLNRGDGTFHEMPEASLGEAPPYGQMRVVDANRDGRLDVVSGWSPPGEPEIFAVSLRRS